MLNESVFCAQDYVDVLMILITERHGGTSVDHQQSALNIVQQCCSDRCLTVNPNEMELMVFTGRKKHTDHKKPNFYGREVEFSKSAKYLSDIFEAKLT